MGLGDFFKDVGHVAARGIGDIASGLNTVDRYVNPFHQEQGGGPNKSNLLGIGSTAPAGDFVNHTVINPSVEHISHALNWAYDNGISQPISTAMMAGELPGGPLHSANWVNAWHAANHISPAQAFLLNSQETKQAVDSPLLYYKPDSAYLPPGFDDLPEAEQQARLKDAGMPVVGNAYIQELRQSSDLFKYSTGAGDLALRWYADPLILGGKAVSAGKRALITKPVTASGRSAESIDKIMNSSVMSRAVDYLWKNHDNPALLNNLQMARESAMGPRFGSIVSTLRNPQEVHDFLRVTLGDKDAFARLSQANALADARVSQDTGRLSRLIGTRSNYLNNPNLLAMIDRHLNLLQQGINADTAMVQSYNRVLDHADSMDAVNLTRWNNASFQRAEQRTAAQEGYRANAARGAKAGRQVTIQPTPLLFSRGTATPVDLGFQKSRLYGAGDFFSSPVTVVRSFANARPNGYMRVDDIDKDSVAELRGQVARIPGISDKARLDILNRYLKAETEKDRLRILEEVGRMGAAKVADKHGFSPSVGEDIYREHLKRQVGEIDNMKRYSAAYKPFQMANGQIARIHVDEFADNGGKLVVAPNLVTRLVNSHVFQDLDEMDKVLARHGSALKAIRTSRLGNPDWIMDSADYMTSLFKFGTLFRLGYIPRVASDDLTGQVARLGSAAMAMRFGWGVRNGATNTAMWLNRPFSLASARAYQQGADFASDGMRTVQADIDALSLHISTFRQGARRQVTNAGRQVAVTQRAIGRLSPRARPTTIARLNAQLAQNQTDLAAATRAMSVGVGPETLRLRDMESHHAWLDAERAKAQALADHHMARYTGEAKQTQGKQATVIKAPRGRVAGLPVGARTGPDLPVPAAFQGNEGEMYERSITADDAIGQIFLTNKSIIHGHLMRSFDHGGKSISPAQDESLHATSWAHAINAQLVQDELGNQAIRGASVAQMEEWLTRTAAGRIYWNRLGLDMTTPEDVAQRVRADVDEYLPTPEIVQKALEPGGVTPQFLKDAMPMEARPEVHTGQVGNSQLKYHRALDQVMKSWFDMASTIPANRLSRHPLFNQLYIGHFKTLRATAERQGALNTTVDGMNRMATAARRLALRDTRKLVFDIAHRSDASAAMRFVMPFMTATNESFQRWGRIIADRPQTIGYANTIYNAPASMSGVNILGMHFNGMQDADGNQIDRNGYSYVIDPKTGKAVKQLVPKAQRYIVGRMPSWVLKNSVGLALGVERASGNFKLSQNSMDLVTQGDPWFSPGMGPIVQIPVNELVKDKPKYAEMARHLDILPFGPQQGDLLGTNILGRSASFFVPSTIKNFLTAYDTSDSRYQAVKAQIVQKAIFEHETMGKPMPSASKISDMTKNYWKFSALSSFLQPMATQRKDAYQFYRDQYNALQRQNPKTADQEFISRYGESYFIFAESQSKNNTGIQATRKAVDLSQKYKDLLAGNPELGALIVGPEGNGPFSPEAYSYQLNTPLSPGGAEMQRTKMNADDMLKENRRRLGWSQFTGFMNTLTSQLHNQGFNSFSDKGAESLNLQKKALVILLGSPTLPDGSTNSFYNEAWSQDFNTLDPLKYERLIPNMQKLVDSPLGRDKSRSDIRVLGQYLDQRKAFTELLTARKTAGGSGVITAKANADVLNMWQKYVDGLVESNTNFGDLHSRYLARDLGYDGSLQEA